MKAKEANLASKKTSAKPTSESHTFPHIKHAKKRARARLIDHAPERAIETLI